MNTTNLNTDGPRTRRQAILAALLVALMGLTVLPGFKCTEEKPDGTKRSIEFE